MRLIVPAAATVMALGGAVTAAAPSSVGSATAPDPCADVEVDTTDAGPTRPTASADPLPVGGDIAGWGFAAPDGGFSAEFPAIPAHVDGATIGPGGDEVELEQWSYHEPTGEFGVLRTVAAATLPDAAAWVGELLGSVPTACTAIANGATSGIELAGSAEYSGPATYLARVFAGGDGTTVAFAVGLDAGELISRRAPTFVASLRLGSEAAPPPSSTPGATAAAVYVSPDGDFSAAFPAEPTVASAPTTLGDGSSATSTLYSAELEDGRLFGVVRLDLPERYDHYDFDGGQLGVLAQTGDPEAQVVDSENQLRNGHRARLFTGAFTTGGDPGSTVTLLVFTADTRRVYQATVIGPGSFDATDPAVAGFINSFVINPEGTP